jgi:hypothetical protein
MQEVVTRSIASGISDLTMQDILEKARAHVAANGLAQST